MEGFSSAADLVVMIDTNAEKFTNGLNAARAEVAKFAGEGSGSLGLFDATVGKLSGGITTFRGGLAALVPQLQAAHAAAAMAIEQLGPVAEALGAKAEFDEATAAIADLGEAVAQAPAAIGDAVSDGAMRLAVGATEMARSFGLISAAAEAATVKSETFVQSLTKAAGSIVREMADSLRELTGGWNTNAEAIGKSVEHLQRVIELNKVYADDARRAGSVDVAEAYERRNRALEHEIFLRQMLAGIESLGAPPKPDDEKFGKYLQDLERRAEDATIKLKQFGRTAAEIAAETERLRMDRAIADQGLDPNDDQRARAEAAIAAIRQQGAALKALTDAETERRRAEAEGQRAQQTKDRALGSIDRELMTLRERAAVMREGVAASSEAAAVERVLFQLRQANIPIGEEELDGLRSKARAIADLQMALDSAQKTTRLFEEAGQTATRALGTAFRSWASGTKLEIADVQKMMRAFVDDLRNMLFQKLVLDQIVSTITRGVSGLTAPPASGIGAWSTTTIPGRSKGGMANAGEAYKVGEVGEEVFIPRVPGTIVPNTALGGGGPPNVVLNITAPPGTTARETNRQQSGSGFSMDIMIEQIEDAMGQRVAEGRSSLGDAMTQRFGLSNAAGAR